MPHSFNFDCISSFFFLEGWKGGRVQASWHHTTSKRKIKKDIQLKLQRKIRSLEGVNSSVKSINCLGLKCSISTCFCHCFYNFKFQRAKNQILLSFFLLYYPLFAMNYKLVNIFSENSYKNLLHFQWKKWFLTDIS